VNIRKSISELKNLHIGADIYVIGSGPSTDHMSPGFFDGKIVVGCNEAYQRFRTDYTITLHTCVIRAALENKQVVVAPMNECADRSSPANAEAGDMYIYSHKAWRHGDVEANTARCLDTIGKDDDLFMVHTVITGAIHFAAHLGAKNIILCGIDCGFLDGKMNNEGYQYGTVLQIHDNNEERYLEFMEKWFLKSQELVLRMRPRIKEAYGSEIFSIVPFIGLDLEGHVFSHKPSGGIGLK
jgi:hypothetical protein